LEENIYFVIPSIGRTYITATPGLLSGNINNFLAGTLTPPSHLPDISSAWIRTYCGKMKVSFKSTLEDASGEYKRSTIIVHGAALPAATHRVLEACC
jgi:hypothetical protein